MSASVARLSATIVGVVTFAVAGVVTGGWWWMPAGVGAVAAVGSMFDHKVAYVTVVAAMAVAVGAVVVDHRWLVVAVAVGVVASIELGASADRTTIVTPTVAPAGDVTRAVVAAAGLSTAVVVAGAMTTGGPPWAAVAAAVAGGFSLRLLAR